MKLSGIHLAVCVAGKVFPDVTRVLASCMIFCKGNHVFLVVCLILSLLPHLPQPSVVVVSPLRLSYS